MITRNIINDKIDSDYIYYIYKYLQEQISYPLYNKEDLIDDLNIFKQNNKDQFLIKDFKNKLKDFLLNEISIKNNHMLDKNEINCCPDITKYIDFEDIENILPKETFDSIFVN